MLAFLKELSQRVQQHTVEVRAHACLLQCLSVAVHRGNAISISVAGPILGITGSVFNFSLIMYLLLI